MHGHGSQVLYMSFDRFLLADHLIYLKLTKVSYDPKVELLAAELLFLSLNN
jgi:hypothetical protein